MPQEAKAQEGLDDGHQCGQSVFRAQQFKKDRDDDLAEQDERGLARGLIARA